MWLLHKTRILCQEGPDRVWTLWTMVPSEMCRSHCRNHCRSRNPLEHIHIPDEERPVQKNYYILSKTIWEPLLKDLKNLETTITQQIKNKLDINAIWKQFKSSLLKTLQKKCINHLTQGNSKAMDE